MYLPRLDTCCLHGNKTVQPSLKDDMLALSWQFAEQGHVFCWQKIISKSKAIVIVTGGFCDLVTVVSFRVIAKLNFFGHSLDFNPAHKISDRVCNKMEPSVKKQNFEITLSKGSVKSFGTSSSSMYCVLLDLQIV
jgi:hypothetical protein